LKEEIGLTDNDITIIIFTSMDISYLTDLICRPGQFLKWFTVNFAGEGRQELDFLESKLELWEETVSLTDEIFKAAQDLTGSKDLITTSEWWEKVRY